MVRLLFRGRPVCTSFQHHCQTTLRYGSTVDMASSLETNGPQCKNPN